MKQSMHSIDGVALKTLSRILRSHLNLPIDITLKSQPHLLLENFRELPVTSFDDYMSLIEEDYHTGYSRISRNATIFFATTSGNTGVPKLIPHTRGTLAAYFRSTFPFLRKLVKQTGFSLLQGRLALISGKEHDSISPKKINVGSISGKIASMLYRAAPCLFAYSPPKADAMDPDSRYGYMVESTRQQNLIGVLGTNPLLIHRFLADVCYGTELNRQCFGDLKGAFKVLRFIVCMTGWPGSWHSHDLSRSLGDVSIYDIGVGASEALYTASLLRPEPLGLPTTNSANFIEWLPCGEDPTEARYDIRQFIGCKVEPILTSSNGFLRYRIGDEYQVENFNGRAVLRFLHRICDTYSLTTERITPATISFVIKKLDLHLNLRVRDYICIMEELSKGRGRYWMIISTDKNDFTEFDEKTLADSVDNWLMNCNPEVRNARQSDRFLLRPKVLLGRVARSMIDAVRSEFRSVSGQPKETVVLGNSKAKMLLASYYKG